MISHLAIVKMALRIWDQASRNPGNVLYGQYTIKIKNLQEGISKKFFKKLLGQHFRKFHDFFAKKISDDFFHQNFWKISRTFFRAKAPFSFVSEPQLSKTPKNSFVAFLVAEISSFYWAYELTVQFGFGKDLVIAAPTVGNFFEFDPPPKTLVSGVLWNKGGQTQGTPLMM